MVPLCPLTHSSLRIVEVFLRCLDTAICVLSLPSKQIFISKFFKIMSQAHIMETRSQRRRQADNDATTVTQAPTPEPDSCSSSIISDNRAARTKYGFTGTRSQARSEAYSEQESVYAFPEAGTIYVQTDGFEELKRRPCESCIVEFLRHNPGLPITFAEGISEKRQPFNNHAVLRLQIKGAPIEVTVKSKSVLAVGVRCSPEVARMPSLRTYLAAKPVHYAGPSIPATAAFCKSGSPTAGPFVLHSGTSLV